jgi:hypothetical protein
VKQRIREKSNVSRVKTCEVETDAAALELETDANDLELETSAASL